MNDCFADAWPASARAERLAALEKLEIPVWVVRRLRSTRPDRPLSGRCRLWTRADGGAASTASTELNPASADSGTSSHSPGSHLQRPSQTAATSHTRVTYRPRSRRRP